MATETVTTLHTSLPSPQDEGTSIDVWVTIEPEPDEGTVTYYLDGAEFDTGWIEGTSLLLPIGHHVLTATYSGSDQFEPSTSEPVPFASSIPWNSTQIRWWLLYGQEPGGESAAHGSGW